jgi:outer membrane biosynthesis protein TonB
MPKKSQAPKMVFIAVSALLLGTLACALDFGNSGDGSEISVQQTLVALRITQAALENQEADPPPDPPVNTEEPQPEEPQTEAVPTEPPDIVFEGAAFSYD